MKNYAVNKKFKEFLNKRIILYWAEENSEIGQKIEYKDVTPNKGILIISDLIYEENIFNSIISCNPKIHTFSNIADKNCLKTVKKAIKEYFECEASYF